MIHCLLAQQDTTYQQSTGKYNIVRMLRTCLSSIILRSNACSSTERRPRPRLLYTMTPSEYEARID